MRAMDDQPSSPSWGLARRGFDAVKESGQVVMRKVVAGLEKEEGKRSPCHGCRGSGQLCHKGQMQPSDKDPPCWFCLGIGLLPVTDLQGFLIAHNPPLFRTTDEQYYKAPPVRIRLYLAKYPGAQCKLTTSRLSKETKRSLFATMAPVSPLGGSSIDNSSDAALKSRLPRLRAVEQHSFRRGGSPFAGDGATLRTQDLPAEPVSPSRQRTGSPSANELLENEWGEAESRSPRARRRNLSGDKSPRIKPRDNSSSSSLTRQDGDAASPTSASSRRQAVRNGRNLSPSSPASPVNSLNNGGGAQRGSPSRGRGSEGRGGTDGSGSPQPRSPSAGSPRPRSPRRDRNRIREKAEREAVERTRRLQRPASPRSALPAENGGSPGLEGARQIAGGRWEAESWNEGKVPKDGGSKNFFSSLFGGN